MIPDSSIFFFWKADLKSTVLVQGFGKCVPCVCNKRY